MSEEIMNTRNEALEFARRTRRNLEYIEQGVKKGDPVHQVTQLTLSLLGLVVIPRERNYLDEVSVMSIAQLRAKAWPNWTILLDDPKERTSSLGHLLKHLRNAACHGGLIYNSDSRNIEDVTIIVENRKPGIRETYWKASISAKDLRTFCYNLLNLIESTVG